MLRAIVYWRKSGTVKRVIDASAGCFFPEYGNPAQ